MQAVAGGSTTVQITVTDSASQPVTSGAVTLVGPAGVSFSPPNPTLNAGGSATSTMTTSDTWAAPGSTLAITATSSGASGAAGLIVIGANALAGGLNGLAVTTAGALERGAVGTGSTNISINPPAQLLKAFTSPIVSLVQIAHAGTGATSLALLQDGTVWAVGNNTYGQLGDGTRTSRKTWGRVSGLSDVVEICGGGAFGLARLRNGEVRGWGNNDYGALGNGTFAGSTTPVAVQGITSAVKLAAGNYTGYAMLSSGQVRAWGYGTFGSLGNGSMSNSNVPVTVSGINTATDITSTSYTPYALLRNGEIMSWGSNNSGERGDGSATGSFVGTSVPGKVVGISNAVEVSPYRGGAIARLSSGEVRAWGSGAFGILGNGSGSTSASTPVAVSGITNATRIAATVSSAFARLATGSFVAWGRNSYYELNDGTTADRATPGAYTPPSASNSLPCASPYSDAIFSIR
jgi:alpha-tubulin suppressor-like RCC1 family protein